MSRAMRDAANSSLVPVEIAGQYAAQYKETLLSVLENFSQQFKNSDKKSELSKKLSDFIEAVKKGDSLGKLSFKDLVDVLGEIGNITLAYWDQLIWGTKQSEYIEYTFNASTITQLKKLPEPMLHTNLSPWIMLLLNERQKEEIFNLAKQELKIKQELEAKKGSQILFDITDDMLSITWNGGRSSEIDDALVYILSYLNLLPTSFLVSTNIFRSLHNTSHSWPLRALSLGSKDTPPFTRAVYDFSFQEELKYAANESEGVFSNSAANFRVIADIPLSADQKQKLTDILTEAGFRDVRNDEPTFPHYLLEEGEEGNDTLYLISTERDVTETQLTQVRKQLIDLGIEGVESFIATPFDASNFRAIGITGPKDSIDQCKTKIAIAKQCKEIDDELSKAAHKIEYGPVRASFLAGATHLNSATESTAITTQKIVTIKNSAGNKLNKILKIPQLTTTLWSPDGKVIVVAPIIIIDSKGTLDTVDHEIRRIPTSGMPPIQYMNKATVDLKKWQNDDGYFWWWPTFRRAVIGSSIPVITFTPKECIEFGSDDHDNVELLQIELESIRSLLPVTSEPCSGSTSDFQDKCTRSRGKSLKGGVGTTVNDTHVIQAVVSKTRASVDPGTFLFYFGAKHELIAYFTITVSQEATADEIKGIFEKGVNSIKDNMIMRGKQTYRLHQLDELGLQLPPVDRFTRVMCHQKIFFAEGSSFITTENPPLAEKLTMLRDQLIEIFEQIAGERTDLELQDCIEWFKLALSEKELESYTGESPVSELSIFHLLLLVKVLNRINSNPAVERLGTNSNSSFFVSSGSDPIPVSVIFRECLLDVRNQWGNYSEHGLILNDILNAIAAEIHKTFPQFQLERSEEIKNGSDLEKSGIERTIQQYVQKMDLLIELTGKLGDEIKRSTTSSSADAGLRLSA